MSLINSIGGSGKPASRALSESAEPKKTQAASWTRPGAEAAGGKAQSASVSADKVPNWVTAAGQQIAGVTERLLPGPYNLGIYIGKNIRTFSDSRGDIRADIAALLQHPAVLAAAATVAPRIIGALAMNQLAFNAPAQVGQHPPV